MRIQFVLTIVFLASTGCRYSANIHSVDEGRLIRSAQLTGVELEKVFRSFGIRSVINLRGEAPGKDWYEEELATARRFGVTHASVKLSAMQIPSRTQLLKILELLRDAPRPILLHCRAGADRTGLVAAIYQFDYMGAPKNKAKDMLSIKYFHFAAVTGAMDYFFEKYQGPTWARDQFDPCRDNYRYFDRAKSSDCNTSIHDDLLTPEEDS